MLSYFVLKSFISFFKLKNIIQDTIIALNIIFSEKRILESSQCSGKTSATTIKPGSRVIPRKRETILKWGGWGYNDTQFKLNSEGHVRI